MAINSKIKILMAAAEIAPFAKVGGLADVLGSLPKALSGYGVDIRLIMPLYGCIDRKAWNIVKTAKKISVRSGRLLISIQVHEALLPDSNIPVYFIDAPEYFGGREIYSENNNSERFLFFSWAVLNALDAIDFIPDIIHCHDFHTALIPDMVKASENEKIGKIRTVYTIHNFHYQGKSKPQVLSTGNLHPQSLKTLTDDAADGDINFMVQGVLNANAVNTVSPTYAKEIATSAYGARLDNVIRMRKNDICGILNGIDQDRFDPARDTLIRKNYSIKDLGSKTDNKTFLQKQLGLPVDPHKALCGLVSRLAWQKGIDLITDDFAELDCQFVFLGKGAAEYEKRLDSLQIKFPDKIKAIFKNDFRLAQQIYAGSDIFLMPSRYEPCGLGQMIAMRYGAIPVVRHTGGLADTVNQNNGFSFKSVSGGDFRSALQAALNAFYHQKDKWREMQLCGMRQDFSWDKSAEEYFKLYQKILNNE